MNLTDRLLKSQSNAKIDFSKYQSSGTNGPLVKVQSSDKILIQPFWTIKGDWEGERYADYIKDHPDYDGIYVRSELAKRLQNAAEKLDSKYQLVIHAGHRPIGVQRQILIDCADDYKDEHPGASDEEAMEHARTFVSDPETSLPPHVCGAAVDVNIVEIATGKPLDFGSKVNDDVAESFLYYPNLTQKQKDNRLMLVTAMLDAGLASCKPEWWHFSYGDQVWAWFYDKENSLYDPIDLTEV